MLKLGAGTSTALRCRSMASCCGSLTFSIISGSGSVWDELGAGRLLIAVRWTGSAGRRGVSGADQLLLSERLLLGVNSGDVSGDEVVGTTENSTTSGALVRRASKSAMGTPEATASMTRFTSIASSLGSSGTSLLDACVRG